MLTPEAYRRELPDYAKLGAQRLLEAE